MAFSKDFARIETAHSALPIHIVLPGGFQMDGGDEMQWGPTVPILRSPIVIGLAASVLIAPAGLAGAAGKAKAAVGPTAEGAMAADDQLTRALRDNDPDGIARWLSDEWAVIPARGGVNEGKSVFPEAIKSGYLKHTAYEASEPRVRLYGNVALVTTKLHNAGTFGRDGKPYDVMERQTDIWLWKDGAWKCVLTHEAWEGAEKDQKKLAN